LEASRSAGPIAHCWRILTCTFWRASKDNLSGLAAGAAFYALLSIFPALTALVSVYGLAADQSMVAQHITAMAGFLPPEADKLVATWLQTFVQGPPIRFGLGLIASVLLAFWSAWSATAILMTAIHTCYGEEEKRSFVRFNLRAMVLAAGLALFGVAALALAAVLPAALALLPVPAAWRAVFSLVRWPILTAIVMVALAIVYHYAPNRAQPKWQWISWGSAVATTLWILGSVTFTVYVSRIGNYDRVYGSISAVIILLLWLFLSAYITLIGAELNAEIDRQAARKPPDDARLDPCQSLSSSPIVELGSSRENDP
jgi:membrane protein